MSQNSLNVSTISTTWL